MTSYRTPWGRMGLNPRINLKLSPRLSKVSKMSSSHHLVQLLNPDGVPVVGGLVNAVLVNGRLVPAPPPRGPLPGIVSMGSYVLPSFRNGVDWADDEEGWVYPVTRHGRQWRPTTGGRQKQRRSQA